MPGAIGWSAEVLSPRGGIRVRQQFQLLGFYGAGFLCLVLVVLKRRSRGSGCGGVSRYLYGWCWATMLCTSRSGLLGSFSPTTAQQRRKSRSARTRAIGLPTGSDAGLIIFVDDLLRRIDGHEEMMWFGVSAGKWELILVSGVLCLVCHLLSWSRIAPAGNP